MSPGDAIIDGSNGWYENTERRTRPAADRGILYLSTGVFEGEEGSHLSIGAAAVERVELCPKSAREIVIVELQFQQLKASDEAERDRSRQGIEGEIDRFEVHLLMRVHHRNLVPFIGYCQEDGNMALIYEYMAQGHLGSHLLDSNSNALSWDRRLRIALDVAQGLEYLHNGCKPPIIHRDVKTANILLNEKLEAKIGDFGLSKAFSDDFTHVSTAVKGTFGYLDPEYCNSNNLTEKSDVYSFGVVLLQLITGKPAIVRISASERRSLIDWAIPIVVEGDARDSDEPERGISATLKGHDDCRLEYLHNGCKPPIIHRDVKTANILLNERLEAKIGDFGLSKVFSDDFTHVSTAVKGTFGYLDPEYCNSNNLTEKSDVYSYGVVLLQLITGKTAIVQISDSARRSLIDWAIPMVVGGDIMDVIDPKLEGNYDIKSIQKVAEIARACTSPKSVDRPLIRDVVIELKEYIGNEKPLESAPESGGWCIDNGPVQTTSQIFSYLSAR
ncbi:hypothetical protein AAC387_Pa03g4447 [Persea americana]